MLYMSGMTLTEAEKKIRLLNLRIMKLSNARGELYEELERHEEGSEAFNRIYETIKEMLAEEGRLIELLEPNPFYIYNTTTEELEANN